MRLALTILLSLVLLALGFALGGLKPRREIAELRAEVTKLEDDVKQANERSATRRALSFLPLPGLERLSEGQRGEREQGADTDDSERRRSGRWWRSYRPERDRRGDASPDAGDRPRTPEQRMERFNTIADAQKIRADQSRQALREQARLDEPQVQAVNQLLGTMNERLAPHAEVLLDLVDSDVPPEPTELLFISREVASILYDTQAEFEDTVGASSMREVDDQARQVWNYVDLEMFRAAAERLAERRAREPSAGAEPTR
jgi:hypothetical protein